MLSYISAWASALPYSTLMGNARSLKRWDAATGAGPTLFPFISQCIRIYYAEAGGSLRRRLTVMNSIFNLYFGLGSDGHDTSRGV